MKQILSFATLVVLLLLSSGCVMFNSVDPSHVGVLTDGGRITQCVGSGMQNDWGMFAGIDQISSNTLTQVVEDKSVVTSDLQPIDAQVTLQYRRKTTMLDPVTNKVVLDCNSITDAITRWNKLAHDDKELQTTMDNIVSQGIKVAVSQFTLNQLLADRTAMAGTILQDLKPIAASFDVEIVTVGVKNVNPAQAYLDVLEQKALLTVQIEAAQKKQDLIRQESANAQLQAQQNVLVQQQQLLVEQANTATQLEIAQRQGKIVGAQNQIYHDNKEAYNLAVLDRLQKVLGDKSTIYFVTPGTDINLLLGQFAGVVPISGTVPAK